jgi:NADH:ubiquinone oxidoreductase subunit 2 (subunit N)
MSVTCFWVVCRVAADGRNHLLEDLNGLHHRTPLLAFVMATGVFSLVVLAALNTAISLYYYLNIVRHAYTQDDPGREPVQMIEPIYSNTWGLVLAGLVLGLGIMPGPVFNAAVAAGSRLLVH